MVGKTTGEVSAKLLAELYQQNKMIFGIDDALKILKTNYNSTKQLLIDMTARNLLVRIKTGSYIIVPEGITGPYIGNWYVAAREISNSPEYYISHYSAMAIHNMLTQPLLKVYISSPKRQLSSKKLKDKFKFVFVKKDNIWGIEDNWITTTEKIRISDIERTIIDCLSRPEYCGGITEIAKGIGIKKKDIDLDKLLQYVIKYGKKVVAKRLGFLLESIGFGESIFKELKRHINNRYDVLDPSLPTDPSYKNNWFLCANVNPDEIRNIILT